jgi:hypothetical protein
MSWQGIASGAAFSHRRLDMTMRSLLALGLLMTLCASASAATVNHSRTRGGSAGGDMGGYGNSAQVGNIEIDHMAHFYPTMFRFGRHWSGYSMYPYDPDCYDFNFRHPDYPSQPSCG